MQSELPLSSNWSWNRLYFTVFTLEAAHEKKEEGFEGIIYLWFKSSNGVHTTMLPREETPQ